MNNQFYHINDELLVKCLLGEATAEEQAQVQEWINDNESNRKYHEQLQLIWEQSKALAASQQADEHKAWKRFQQRIHQPGQASLPVKNFHWLRIAALIIIIAGAAWIGLTLITGSPAPDILMATNDAVLTETLSDGSVITLNKKSLLTYPEKFKGNKRQVSLKGEAFFAVAPDSKKPFIIQSNHVTITVVGTSFNVRNLGNATEVIVETGVVRVTHNNNSIELKPGEKITIDEDDLTLVKNKQEDKLYNYYRTKEFVCDNTPLWKLVYALNEAYNAQIEIANPKIRNLPVNTTFNNESLDRILEIIQLTFNISVSRSGDKIILR